MSNKPIHSIRIGFNSIAVFENQTSTGRTMLNAKLERSYKDGDEWKHSQSFSLDDLCVQSELIDRAKEWMIAHQADVDDSHAATPTI